jgi:hypothetical protein
MPVVQHENTEQLCGLSSCGHWGMVADMSDLTLLVLGISSVVITAATLIFLWHP